MSKLLNVKQGEDADLGAVTVTSLSINGQDIAATSVLLAEGEVIDLNGEADALVLDADQDTTISAPTDDQIDIEIKSVDHVVLKAVATADSGATNNIVEIAMTTPVDTTGTNTHNALNIDVEIGNASGGTNAVRAIAIDAITGDAQVTETAIYIGSGWDVGIAVDAIGESTSGNGVIIDGLTIKDGIVGVIQAITGDGAITIQNASVFLSKGSAAAITLAAPTAGTHDGIIIRVVAISAQAHVITGGVDGFNAKGSSGTITFGGAIGDSVTLVAYNGHWYTLAAINATVA